MKIKPYNNAPDCRVGLLKSKINVNIALSQENLHYERLETGLVGLDCAVKLIMSGNGPDIQP